MKTFADAEVLKIVASICLNHFDDLSNLSDLSRNKPRRQATVTGIAYKGVSFKCLVQDTLSLAPETSPNFDVSCTNT